MTEITNTADAFNLAELDSAQGLALAENLSTAPEVFEQLVKDPNPWVRRMVAEQPNQPTTTMAILALDAQGPVRHSVARNRQTPPAVLTTLAKDPEVDVRYRPVGLNTQLFTDLDVVLSLNSDLFKGAILSKVTIKKGPMTIGPVSIGSMEITMDSATLEFIQSRLGIKRPELLQDLAEIVADDAIVSVHAKGARLEGGSKPKFRLVRRAQE